MNKNFPKSIQFYTIKEGFAFDMEAINEQLEALRFKPCLPESGGSIGFISPFGESELCYKLANGGFIVKIREQEKIISASEVSRLVNERAKLIEQEEGRLVRGRERVALKCLIVEELRRNAQSRFKELSIMVLPELKLLCILNAPATLADEVTALFRKAIGSLPIAIAEVKHVVLKGLYSQTIAANCFELVDKVKLHNPVSKGTASFDSCDWNDGVNELLDSGYEITEIGVSLCGFFSFSLDAQGKISRVKWSEEIASKSNVEYEAPPIKDGEEYDDEAAKREQAISIAIADAYLAQLGIESYVTQFISLLGGFKAFMGKVEDESKEKDAGNDTKN